MDFQIADDFGSYAGAAAGIAVVERWEYPGVGYNATDGIFYVGEEKRDSLVMVPFALRQCKEVEDLSGAIHRYPIKTRKSELVDGPVVQRVQVVGLVDGELHIFGARSWTARAAWLNPRGGAYRDDHFETGMWYRLEDYIKAVKAEKGITTAPLCYEIKLEPGTAIKMASAANAKQTSTGVPIIAKSLRFVGPEQASANEALFVEQELDEWQAEWNKGSVGTADQAAAEPDMIEQALAEPDDIPF